MSLPCKANCKNQKKGRCQLKDEAIENTMVEFGDDWDPVENCSCFSPQDRKVQNNCKKNQR